MNKKLIIPVLLVLLFAPVTNTRATCVGCAGISAGAAAGITLGVAGGIALIAGLVHHHHKKQRQEGQQPQAQQQKQVSTRRARKQKQAVVQKHEVKQVQAIPQKA